MDKIIYPFFSQNEPFLIYSQRCIKIPGAVLGYFQRVCFGWEGWGVGDAKPPKGPRAGGPGCLPRKIFEFNPFKCIF